MNSYGSMNRHERCVEGWVKGMRTDRQRLDWLAAQSSAELVSTGTYWKLTLRGKDPFQANSIRDVINAAIEAEKLP